MEKKELTNWQVIRMGVAPWLVFLVIPLLGIAVGELRADGFLFWCIVSLPTIPGGIVGSVIAKKRGSSQKIVWVGAFLGAILGMGICLLLLLPLGLFYCFFCA